MTEDEPPLPPSLALLFLPARVCWHIGGVGSWNDLVLFVSSGWAFVLLFSII